MATATNNETWKEIPSTGGVYSASADGMIRRNKVSPFHPKHSGILKGTLTPGGYYCVSIHAPGHRKRRYVHTLVAEAFFGPAPDGMEVNHIDGCKHNNCSTNLEYVSRLENIRHSWRLGLATGKSADSNSYSKLTSGMVLEIIALEGKETQKAIAARYGVSRRAIGMIYSGQTWATVTGKTPKAVCRG